MAARSRPDPVERAREEGASPFLVAVVRRVHGWWPPGGRAVGFWVAVYGRFVRHRGSVLAGGLAFFGLLSLVPSLVVLGAVVALTINPATFVSEVQQVLAQQPELLAALQPALTEIAGMGSVRLSSVGAAGVASVLVALYAASRFVYVGRQVLDVAFELEPRAPTLLSRGVAILITLAAQLAVVLGVVVLTVVPRVLDALGIGGAYAESIRLIRAPVATVIVYLLLTASMRFGIHARGRVPWLNLGGLAGALLVLVGTFGLGWYLTNSATYSQIVAVLGGVIALEIWLYVVGLAIVAAAEVEGVRCGFRRRDRLDPVPAGEPPQPA